MTFEAYQKITSVIARITAQTMNICGSGIGVGYACPPGTGMIWKMVQGDLADSRTNPITITIHMPRMPAIIAEVRDEDDRVPHEESLPVLRTIVSTVTIIPPIATSPKSDMNFRLMPPMGLTHAPGVNL